MMCRTVFCNCITHNFKIILIIIYLNNKYCINKTCNKINKQAKKKYSGDYKFLHHTIVT